MATTTTPLPALHLPRFGNVMPNDIIKRLIDLEQLLMTGYLPGTTNTGGTKFLQGSHANPVTADTTLDSYGTGGSTWLLRAANGAMALPNSTVNGDFLGSFAFGGYGTNSFGFSRPGMYAFAEEDWADNAQASRLSFLTTDTGHGNSTEAARFVPAGGFVNGDIPNLARDSDGIAIVTTNGSPTITAFSGSYTFKTSDIGRRVRGSNPDPIPYGTIIFDVASDGTSARMSSNATSTSALAIVTLGGPFGTGGDAYSLAPYATRTNAIFAGHSSYVPFGSGTSDPHEYVVHFTVIDDVWDDVVGSQASSIIPGGRGLYQLEGTRTIGPNHRPIDAVGGPTWNLSLGFAPMAGNFDVAPGGTITGISDSSWFNASSNGQSFSMFANSSHWANKLFVASAGGTMLMGEVTDFITVDALERAQSHPILGTGAAAFMGRWTGYYAQSPGINGHTPFAPVTIGRAVHFDAGAQRFRNPTVTTAANSRVVTAATTVFRDEDLGAVVFSLIPATYNPSTAYSVFDNVFYLGRIFVCATAGTGHTPPTTATDNTWWQYLCQAPLRLFITKVISGTQAEVNVKIPAAFTGVMKMNDVMLEPIGGEAYAGDAVYAKGARVQYLGESFICNTAGTTGGNAPQLNAAFDLDYEVPRNAGLRTASPMVYTTIGNQNVTGSGVQINPVGGVVRITSSADVTLTAPGVYIGNLMDGAHFTVINRGAYTITVPASLNVPKACVLAPGDAVTWRYEFGGLIGVLVEMSGPKASSFIQTFTQISDVTGNQGNPLHVQVNDTVDYVGPNLGFLGGFTPKTTQTFVGAAFDGTNGYPAVMQGPTGHFQIDGLTEWHYDAGGFGQAAAIIQTATTHKNGPRVTVADVHLTNGSATITSATAAFLTTDTNAYFTASVAGVPRGTTLVYVNATTATMQRWSVASAAFVPSLYTGTTTTTAVGSIWRPLNLPSAALINNSPSWVADKVTTGIANEFTINAPGLQSGYGNPPGIYGITDDQYFSGVDGGWLNASAASGGTDRYSVGFWSLPVWYGHVNMAARYDIFLSEAAIYTDGFTTAADGVCSSTGTTAQKRTITSPTAKFTRSHLKTSIHGDGIPAFAFIDDVIDAHTAVIQIDCIGTFTNAVWTVDGNTPVLDKHVGLYVQSQRQASKNWSIVINSPFVAYDVDSVYSSPLFKDAGLVLGSGALFSIQNAYTLDFANASTGSMFQSTATWRFRQSGSAVGSGTMIQNAATYKNNRRTSAADGHTTTGSTTITSPSMKFTAGDVGATISGTGVPVKKTTTATGITTSGNATISASSSTFASTDVGRPITGAGLAANSTIASFISTTSVTVTPVATSSTTLTVFTIPAASIASVTIVGSADMDATALATNTNTVFTVAANVTLTAVTGVSMQPTFLADGVPFPTSNNVDFSSNATYGGTNGGAISTLSSNTSFQSLLTLDATVTLFTRVGLRVFDITGAGSVGVNYGILIDALANGTVDNWGVYNNAKTYLGGMTVSTAGVVAGTHNLFTTDGVYTTVTGGFGAFGVKYVDNTFTPTLVLARGKTTGGFVAVGDTLGTILFEGATNSGATAFAGGAGVRGVAEEAGGTGTTHGGGRVEILASPIGAIATGVAAAFDSTKAFHLVPTYTSGRITGSALAIKADGSVWVGPTAYDATTHQPTAAGLIISSLGGLTSGSGILSTSPSVGVGYTVGSGGAWTQATSKATAVGTAQATSTNTNAINGRITLNAAALASLTNVSFTFTNSAIAAGDVLPVMHQSGGTAGAYQCWASAMAAGSCTITVRNATAGSLSEAIVIGFAVIKSVNN
jgi:hypothetical protein